MKLKVCLHLDINKTLILQDGSSGRSLEKSLHSLLSECVWGQYPLLTQRNERTLQDWHVISTNPSTTVPTEGLIQSSESNPFSPPVTLGSYVEDHMQLDKAAQRSIKTSFATDSNPVGHIFQSYYKELAHKITLSPGQKQLVSEAEGMSYLAQGYFHILPSVFRLLDFISTLSPERYDIRIIFRSFGTDVFQVADEINRYCEGTHPLFRPTALLDGSVHFDFRLSFPRCSGCFLRTGSESKDLHLSYVDEEQLVSRKSGSKEVFDHIFQHWLALTPSSSAADNNNNKDKNNKPHHSSKHVHAIALRDDYSYWHSQHESDVSGKLLLVDPKQLQRGTELDYVVQLFLDDNIERDRPHIIDVRNRNTFETIPFEVSKNDVIRRVEPWDAVMDTEYFVDILQDLLARFH